MNKSGQSYGLCELMASTQHNVFTKMYLQSSLYSICRCLGFFWENCMMSRVIVILLLVHAHHTKAVQAVIFHC